MIKGYEKKLKKRKELIEMERMSIHIVNFLMIFLMFLVCCLLILKIYGVMREEKFKVTDKILISVPVALYSVFADFAAFSLRPSMEALSGGTYWFFKNLLFTLIILVLIYSPVILFYILVSVFRVKKEHQKNK
jgi:hypothetical protein